MGFDRQDLLRASGTSEDDLVPLASTSVNRSFSITDTTFTSINFADNIPTVDLRGVSQDSSLEISLSFERLNNDTSGETTTIRLADRNSGTAFPQTSVDVTGGPTFDTGGPRATVTTRSVLSIRWEVKVTGGKGQVRAPSATVYLRVD